MLGQYRFPVRHYWRGLTVQLVAYEAQYELQSYFSRRHVKDNMDYAVSNTMGAIAAVLAACLLSFIVEHLAHRPCERRLLYALSACDYRYRVAADRPETAAAHQEPG